jgi:hypothetical protein
MIDLANYRFEDPADNVQRGFNQMNALRQNIGQQQAGKALQGGDVGGARNALLGVGMIDQANKVQDYDQGQQDRVTAASNAKRDALLKFTAEKASDLAQFHSQHQNIDQTLATFDQMAPQFEAMGEKPEEIALVRQHLASDPDGTLAALGAGAAKKLGYEIQNSGDEVFVIDKSTGKLVSHYRGSRTNVVSEGGELARVPGDYGAASGPAAAPPSAEAPAVTTPGHVDPHAPRSVRNNNPGNIKDGSFASSLPGYKGSDGTFAIFETPDAGAAAQARLIQSYGNRGINSVKGIIERWAPATADGNNTQAYIDFVARQVGVSPREQLNLSDPAVAAKVAAAIARFEGGPKVQQASYHTDPQALPTATSEHGDAQPYEVAANGATPPPPSGGVEVLYSRPKDEVKWRPDGKGNLINANGDRKLDPTYEGHAEADPNMVKMVLDGRYPAPTGRAAADPKWQAVLAAASAQDPTFDAANYHARVATRQDFARGKAATTRTALNTALGHAGDLDSQVDGLHNSPLHLVNALGNTYASETGDPRIKTFNLTKDALMHEALKVFSGSSGALAEFKQLSDTLNVNDSPAQQHSVVKKLVGLLSSKMDALGEQWRTGMGKEATASQIMSPHAAAIYEKITGMPVPFAADEGGGQPGAPSQAQAPVHVHTPDEAMRLAPGTVFITPDGRRKVR